MSKIETSLLTDQVYNVLKTKIIDGEHAPGEKLDIQKLSEEFGVSRSPVKDAINQLVYDGLIEIIPRKGTYVTEINYTTFLETLDARLMVEKWAAEQVIHRISAEKIEEMKTIVQEMDDLLKSKPFSFDQYNQLDMKFHHTLVVETKNEMIHDLFKSFNTHIALSRIVRSTSFTSTLKRHQDHWDLYQALKDRNFEAFSKSITAHIHSLRKEAEQIFEEENKNM